VCNYCSIVSSMYIELIMSAPTSPCYTNSKRTGMRMWQPPNGRTFTYTTWSRTPFTKLSPDTCTNLVSNHNQSQTSYDLQNNNNTLTKDRHTQGATTTHTSTLSPYSCMTKHLDSRRSVIHNRTNISTSTSKIKHVKAYTTCT
jgi:hypothetical protein